MLKLAERQGKAPKLNVVLNIIHWTIQFGAFYIH